MPASAAAAEPGPRARRRNALALASLGAASLALLHKGLSFAFSGSAPLSVQQLVPPSGVALSPRSRVAMHAEVVDAEVSSFDDDDDDDDDDIGEADVEGEKDQPDSVFDGFDKKKRPVFLSRFKGKLYNVFRTNRTWYRYVRREKKDGPIVERGLWHQGFSQPLSEYKANRKEYWSLFRRRLKKLWKKHGKGQIYPNGRAIYKTKLRGHPFLRQLWPEYRLKPEWVWDPKEPERRAQRQRARELERRLAMEAEQRRLARLKELGVWPGEDQWRKEPKGTRNKEFTTFEGGRQYKMR